ncbi:NAD(P)-dependent alcohol dehydrogenase [Paraburkholderia aspalathi]|uniref:NAD(P)-dependent alcohol dehydrogenase n=1 Tax=Paraburkholderia aspalathi TaxID=1324617 RepID=UPI003C8226B2
MKISAAVWRALKEPFSIEEVDLENQREHEVLVKIVAVGLCHTDVAVRDGEIPMPAPAILGHEGAGIVMSAPTDSEFEAGDHVVMSFAYCGRCNACLSGRPSSCVLFFAQNFQGHRQDGSCCHSQNGNRIHGNFFGQSSFANYAVAEARHLVKVPNDLPLEKLGPLGCGIQTGAGAVFNWMKPEMGSSFAVFGLGAVGMSALMAAKLFGCDPIIAVDVQPERLKLARELGATHTINAKIDDPVTTIRSLTSGFGADRVVEAIGQPQLANQCVEAVRSRGQVALLGAPRSGENIVFSSTNLLRGLNIKAVVEGDAVPRVFIPELLLLYRKGLFPFDKLLTFYDLVEINEAVSAMSTGIAIKPVLRMSTQ